MLEQCCAEIKPIDGRIRERVQARLDSLTKPPGSLGRLEELAKQIAEIQDTEFPRATKKMVVVMAADHGICEEGVSAYPATVTAQMVRNFSAGGAAINVLARHASANVLVVNMGVAGQIDGNADRNHCIGHGTKNFLHGEAMSREQAVRCLEIGIGLAEEAALSQIDLIAGGDMGIGNTTSSSVITALVTKTSSTDVVGRGTGIDDEGFERKRHVVTEAIRLHLGWHDGVDLLRRVGGFEIGGLAGLMIGAARYRIPVILDGFIATAAALLAAEICPLVKAYMIAAHCSAEPGHAIAQLHLGLDPLLRWSMRLGEGTGAALVFPLVEAACKILAEMATFESAAVSGKLP
jgi:nicotinate-nucleotide--dimethylbenzimidazole phosphoribosyltransferase